MKVNAVVFQTVEFQGFVLIILIKKVNIQDAEFLV